MTEKVHEKSRTYKADHKADNSKFLPNRFIEWAHTQQHNDWLNLPLADWRARYAGTEP